MKRPIDKPPVPKLQDDAYLDQTNPVSDTKYTVLDTTKNCRILSIAIVITWTVQPTPAEIHLTIDGKAITHKQTDPVTATWYYAHRNPAQLPTGQPFSTTMVYHFAFLYEGRSIKAEAEITGGTVSKMQCRVKYAKW